MFKLTQLPPLSVCSALLLLILQTLFISSYRDELIKVIGSICWTILLSSNVIFWILVIYGQYFEPTFCYRNRADLKAHYNGSFKCMSTLIFQIFPRVLLQPWLDHKSLVGSRLPNMFFMAFECQIGNAYQCFSFLTP